MNIKPSNKNTNLTAIIELFDAIRTSYHCARVLMIDLCINGRIYIPISIISPQPSIFPSVFYSLYPEQKPQFLAISITVKPTTATG